MNKTKNPKERDPGFSYQDATLLCLLPFSCVDVLFFIFLHRSCIDSRHVEKIWCQFILFLFCQLFFPLHLGKKITQNRTVATCRERSQGQNGSTLRHNSTQWWRSSQFGPVLQRRRQPFNLHVSYFICFLFISLSILFGPIHIWAVGIVSIRKMWGGLFGSFGTLLSNVIGSVVTPAVFRSGLLMHNSCSERATRKKITSYQQLQGNLKCDLEYKEDGPHFQGGPSLATIFSFERKRELMSILFPPVMRDTVVEMKGGTCEIFDDDSFLIWRWQSVRTTLWLLYSVVMSSSVFL